ncbi:MAG: hypothetical protein ACJ72Z_00715 [Pyrinomonadaceae bacterium]
MTSQISRSITLFSIVIFLSATVFLTAVLAGPGGVPAGAYSVTIAAEDIPPGFPPEAAGILIGTWTTEFTENGETYITKDGESVAEGRYTSSKKHLILTDLSGPLACTDAKGIATGAYTWSLDNNELTMVPVLDRCFGRAFVLSLRPMSRL